MSSPGLPLVANRECGDCTACCHFPAIDQPELQKPAGILCSNCVERRCAIYDSRPAVCRDWYCAWRTLAALDDDWRPDLSGLVAEWEYDLVPAGYQGPGLRFMPFGGDGTQLLREKFVLFIARAVRAKKPVFLLVPDREGVQGRTIFLNERLAPAVESRALIAVATEIVAALQAGHVFFEQRPLNEAMNKLPN